MKTILVTGGAGFIGSHFVKYMLGKYPELHVVNVDVLTYAGRKENLAELEGDKRHIFKQADITDYSAMKDLCEKHEVEAIINFAAETHVDRSIQSGLEFIKTDVEGTYTLLSIVRDLNIPRMVHISTDEVYGDIEAGQCSKETDRLHPSSPYSASKAGGELQCLGFHRTYNTPVIITRCTNNYGSHMYPEKLMPLFITNLLEDKKVPVYGDGLQVRDWLHVSDHCKAIDLVLHKGNVGEIYNIGANNDPEITNMDITKKLLDLLGKDESSIEYVKDRAGHDRRYAVDTSKIEVELGWKPEKSFDEGLTEMVEWYKENESWWKPIKTGEYVEYYKQQYNER